MKITRDGDKLKINFSDINIIVSVLLNLPSTISYLLFLTNFVYDSIAKLSYNSSKKQIFMFRVEIKSYKYFPISYQMYYDSLFYPYQNACQLPTINLVEELSMNL